MFVELDPDKMRSLDGGALIVAACDALSATGVKNYIHWQDEISVSIDNVLHDVIVDYSKCGVHFVHPDNIAYN